MTYLKKYDKKNNCLVIKYLGDFSLTDVPDNFNFYDYMVKLSEEYDCSKILIDSRELIINLDFLEKYKLAIQMSEVSNRKVNFAFLCLEEQLPEDNLFEITVNNRGHHFQVFFTEADAQNWIYEK